MSFEVDWDIEKYRDDHESKDHWQLRRAFMEKWKSNYPEERLVCLARVFTNVELLGCRYPIEVMQEISKLSHEVAQSYRKIKKTKLQRTFVSASDAAEDRAKGVKRKGGIVVEDEPKAKIQFVAAGHDNGSSELHNDERETENASLNENTKEIDPKPGAEESASAKTFPKTNIYDYLEDMSKLDCMNVRGFRENMFTTVFGRMVLLIRPWATKLWNLQTSCKVCNVELQGVYENPTFSFTINGQLLAESTGPTKNEAKWIAEKVAWDRIIQEVISIVVKEQFIAENDTCISVNDVSRRKVRDDQFGTPVEPTVAMKMMQMMGWKGGGLGADAQGIAEPIKPNIQMVNRAGLGSASSDIHQLRKAAYRLMNRYIASDTLDLDLVFSSEFSKEERAVMHQCAQRLRLGSKSYGDTDRFLVVNKKLDPFCLARAVIHKGGNTPKYQVFIPSKLAMMNRKR